MQIKYWVLLILQLAPILATANDIFQDIGNVLETLAIKNALLQDFKGFSNRFL